MAQNFKRSHAPSASLPNIPREASAIVGLLPSLVQSRLPHIPSLRRSLSVYSISPKQKPSTRSSASAPGTPPSELCMQALTLQDDRGYPENSSTESVCSEDEGFRRSVERQDYQTTELVETKTGIGWKFVAPGLSLLRLCASESSSIAQEGVQGAVVTRQLYIDALKYLLRGLPTDLTPDEQLGIRSALGPTIIAPLPAEVSGLSAGRSFLRAEEQPSLLHRTLAFLIIQLFILSQFLLPYIRIFLKNAYEYERTHRISEKVLASSVDVVDVLCKRTAGVTAALWGMGFGEVITWIVDGVAGGIKEGVGEGLKVVGAGNEGGETGRDEV